MAVTHEGLTLEVREGIPMNVGAIGAHYVITPPINEDFWSFRVRLGESGQAIVGFPKFFTIGIGFAKEGDWNTNLPYSCEAEEIYAHIRQNKGDDTISDATCVAAIRMVQAAARATLTRDDV